MNTKIKADVLRRIEFINKNFNLGKIELNGKKYFFVQMFLVNKCDDKGTVIDPDRIIILDVFKELPSITGINTVKRFKFNSDDYEKILSTIEKLINKENKKIDDFDDLPF